MALVKLFLENSKRKEEEWRKLQDELEKQEEERARRYARLIETWTTLTLLLAPRILEKLGLPEKSERESNQQ